MPSTIEMEQVTPNVFTNTKLRGCNPSFVVTSDGVVVIDTPQLPTKAVAMREEAERHGQIRYLINTENHVDHIFGNYWFRGAGEIVNHKALWDIFMDPQAALDPFAYALEAIPTDDPEAWEWNPRHRWVFDKLQVALSQGLRAGPHGTAPPAFPVFSKPIMNFRGLGAGSRILRSAEDYEHHHAPGHFWMTLLEGAHVSTDVAVVDGKPQWWRHVTGAATGEGMFDTWTVHADGTIS